MALSDTVPSPSYIHYVRRHPSHSHLHSQTPSSSSSSSSSSPSSSSGVVTVDNKFLAALLERSRAQRDTYDERQKLLSTYKIISKTQCLLQMRSTDGFVDAKHVINLDDSQETKDGVFLFLPIAVNLFLIQHKESKRYLCGENHQLFGLLERNERQCVFETKRSDVDFGRWDSYRLFYENANRGYLSISHMCHTRLRRKFDNDNYLNFLAFVRINTDVSSDAAAARRIVNQQENLNPQRMKTFERPQNRSSKLISDYRHRFRFSLLPMTTTTTTTTTTSTTTTTTAPPSFRQIRRKPFTTSTTPFKSLIVHVYSPPSNSTSALATQRWRSRRTHRP